MTLERTLFFIKPYVEPEMAAEIIRQRNKLIKQRIRFNVIEQIEAPTLSLEGWLEFYSAVREKYPTICLEMCRDFSSCPYPIIGDITEGRGIIQIQREVLGESRIVEENPIGTIRRKYGKYNNPDNLGWRTVAHASSTPEQAEDDLEVFRKHRIIH